jgi:hypothetical protein
VLNIPGKGSGEDVAEEGLRELLQGQGLSVQSVALDSPGGSDKKRVAYVRLEPPHPAWLAKAEVGHSFARDHSLGSRDTFDNADMKGTRVLRTWKDCRCDTEEGAV